MCSLQTGVKFSLVLCIQRLQVHSLNGLPQRGHPRGIARRERGNQQRRRQKFLAQVLGIRPALRKVDLQRGALKGLHVHRVQQLHRHRHLFAGLGVVEQHHRLQVVAHGHPPPVEIQNLRHRTVRRSVELEPYPRARQVVAVQRRRNFERLPKPHSLIGSLGAHRHRRPRALIQVRGLTVRQIAAMHLPNSIRQFAQTGQPRDHGLGCGRQVDGNFSGLLGGLRRRDPGKNQDAQQRSKAGKDSAIRFQDSSHSVTILGSILVQFYGNG